MVFGQKRMPETDHGLGVSDGLRPSLTILSLFQSFRLFKASSIFDISKISVTSLLGMLRLWCNCIRASEAIKS